MSSSSSSSPFRYLLAYFLLIIYLQSVAANTNLSFFFKNFGKDSNFESQLALYGDAMIANDNKSLQFAGSGASRAGTIIYKKPINLVEINSGFSNYFVFNISGEKEGRLTFLMLPFGFPVDHVFGGGSMGAFKEREMKFFSVEFYGIRDYEGRVVYKNDNHLEIKFGLDDLSSGEMLQAWIDYESSGKRMMVTFGKLNNIKPVVSLYAVSCHVDLGMVWKGVALGLSSSHMINLYSWSLGRPRIAPQWRHSEPVDPEELMEKKNVKVAKCYRCSLIKLLALILGVGFAAILVLLVWTMLGRRRPVVPEEFTIPAKESESKKYIGP